MKNKKLIFLGAGIAIFIAGVVGFTLLNKDNSDKYKDKPVQVVEMSKQFISATQNGVLNLNDFETGKSLDKFDLKTLRSGKEIVEEIEVKPTPPIEKPKEEVVDKYKDFVKVTKTIKKGDNIWTLQKILTPERDITQMLVLLKDLNGNNKLHPVYPGDKRILLKEDDGKKQIIPQEQKTESKTEIVKKTVEKIDDNAVYIYDHNEDMNTLYAYNDIEKSFYFVTVDNKANRLQAKTLLTNTAINNLKDFEVIGDKIYVLEEKESKIREIEISNPSEIKDYELDGIVDAWEVKDNVIYYTFADKLGKYDISTSEKTNVLVGDKSVNLFVTKDKLFVMNTFGSGLDNNIIMQINPTDLKVEKLTELRSKENKLLSFKEDDFFYIAQIKTLTDLDGKIEKTPVITSVDYKTLEFENTVKDIPYADMSDETEDFLYILKGNKLTVYSVPSLNIEKEVNITGNYFFPLK